MTKKTKAKAKAPRARAPRETSDAVSSDSARLLALGGRFFHERTEGGFAIREQVTRKIRAALASCVNQDQTKGRRAPITLRDLSEAGVHIVVTPSKGPGVLVKAPNPNGPTPYRITRTKGKRGRKGH